MFEQYFLSALLFIICFDYNISIFIVFTVVAVILALVLSNITNSPNFSSQPLLAPIAHLYVYIEFHLFPKLGASYIILDAVIPAV